jgi:hypothetical protein
MKHSLLFTITLFASAILSAQSLTPTVIASAGFGYVSPDLQVDMTVGETFITTLQTPDVILTQGFHQPAVQQQGGGCIDSTLINPDAICPTIIDPVCGCDGVTYDNSCLAESVGGVTLFTPGECGSGAVPGCTAEGACNFNPEATINDNSCLFIGFPCDDGNPLTVDFISPDCVCEGEIDGCMDSLACNYNPNATIDQFSFCEYPGDPCFDGNAQTVDDVYQTDCTCVGLLLGCITPGACNYNVNASVNDDSCIFPGDMCDDNNTSTVDDMITADCVCAGSLLGCMNSNACNYNMEAVVDDGSCILPGDPCNDANAQTVNDIIQVDCSCLGLLQGCMDSTACNYDVIAQVDNGTCTYPGSSCSDGDFTTDDDSLTVDCVCEGIPNGLTPGCTDSLACNYDVNATVNDSTCYFIGDACDDANSMTDLDAYGVDCTCVGQLLGCTNDVACNYNPMALLDDASCLFPGEPCDDGLAETINDVIGVDCGCFGELVQVEGCTVMEACNYDALATIDNGSCFFPGDNCDDGLAETTNDIYGSDCICTGVVAEPLGCTNPNACNYDSLAAIEDGSCFFIGDFCDDGDMMTINDVITADCICQGIEVNVMGCTDETACNYLSEATIDDGSCFFVGDACDDGDANTSDDAYNANCECEGTTSVQELETVFNVFPNPASNEVFVTINGGAAAQVTVFDASGRLLFSVQRTTRVDISALAAGVYMLQVKHDGGMKEQRVIKMD